MTGQTSVEEVATVTQEAEENSEDRLMSSFSQESRVQKGRSLGWCFTLHNYTIEHENVLKSYVSQFLIYGRELTKNGIKHLQGFIQFEAPGKSFHALHKLLPSASWYQSRGKIDENIAYCSKGGDTYHQGKVITETITDSTSNSNTYYFGREKAFVDQRQS